MRCALGAGPLRGGAGERAWLGAPQRGVVSGADGGLVSGPVVHGLAQGLGRLTYRCPYVPGRGAVGLEGAPGRTRTPEAGVQAGGAAAERPCTRGAPRGRRVCTWRPPYGAPPRSGPYGVAEQLRARDVPRGPGAGTRSTARSEGCAPAGARGAPPGAEVGLCWRPLRQPRARGICLRRGGEPGLMAGLTTAGPERLWRSGPGVVGGGGGWECCARLGACW